VFCFFKTTGVADLKNGQNKYFKHVWVFDLQQKS